VVECVDVKPPTSLSSVAEADMAMAGVPSTATEDEARREASLDMGVSPPPLPSFSLASVE
jgi:hypothetical protein